MSNIKNIGIYLAREKAVVSAASIEDGRLCISDSFTVTMQAKADQDCPSLAAQIAAELASRQIEFGSVSIAIDCTMYIQHDIRSSFTDYRQIARTIRFDVEEVIGDDVNRMAMAFYIAKIEDNSSIVTVFTASKSELSAILADFQKHKLDPEIIEPDVAAFGRAVSLEMTDNAERSPLFAAFSDKVCYNAVMNSSHSTPVLRSFLYGSAQNKTQVLQTQLKLTLSRNTVTVPVDTLCVFSDDVDSALIAEKYEMNVPMPEEVLKQNSQVFGKGSTADISAAIAASTAMSITSKRSIDFRLDFSPYQGKKKIVETSLRLVAFAAAVLLFAVAVNYTLSVLEINNSIERINERTRQEYSSAMRGRDLTQGREILALRSEVTRLRRVKSGEEGGDENLISSRLRYILEAINETPDNINLKIDSITVSDGLMRIDGSTNSRANTQRLLSAIDSHERLRRAQESLQQTGAVDSFSINVEIAN